MFASMSTFRGEGIDLDTAAKAAGESMEAWLRQFDGYLGLILLTNQEAGSAHALTFWENAESVEQSEHGRTQMRESMAATIGVDVVASGSYAISFRDGPNLP
jgi:hypothetical protein